LSKKKVQETKGGKGKRPGHLRKMVLSIQEGERVCSYRTQQKRRKKGRERRTRPCRSKIARAGS